MKKSFIVEILLEFQLIIFIRYEALVHLLKSNMVVPGSALHALIEYSQRHHNTKMTEGNVVHKGGCHCGSVRFEVQAPPVLAVIDCNCSICVKKQNRHFIVSHDSFKLIKGHDSMKTYSFGSHQAKHYFCVKCGVQSFYIPRSNPDGYGIAAHCLDEGTVKKVKVEKFNGKQWEEGIKKSAHIKNYSKEKGSAK